MNIFGNSNTNKSFQSGGIVFTNNTPPTSKNLFNKLDIFSVGANNTMPHTNNSNGGIFGNQGGNTNQTTIMSQNTGNNLFGSQNNNQQPSASIFNNAGLSSNNQTGQQGMGLSTPVKNNSNQGINQQGNLFNNQVGNNQIGGTSLFGNQGNQQQGNLNYNQQQGNGLFNSNTNNGITNINSNSTTGNSIFDKNIQSSNLGVNFGSNIGNYNLNQNPQVQENQKGTYHKIFEPLINNEKGEKGEVTNLKFMIFNLDKSIEELRYEDLQLKKNGAVYNQPKTNLIFQNNPGLDSGISNNLNTNMQNTMGAKHSLFGNNQIVENLNNQQQGGGLFAQTNTSNQQQGGLFAQTNTTNQQQGGGLFTRNDNQTTIGLNNMPGNNQQQNSNTSNSLFNTNTSTQQNPTNNLFSNTNNNQQQPSNNFNTNNPNSNIADTNKINTNPTTTSLFDNPLHSQPQLSITIPNTQKEGGLFNTQQGGVQSNLFNNPTTNNPVTNPTTSLFTQDNKLQNQSNLFPTTNPQENKTSLFSQPSSSLSSTLFTNINAMPQSDPNQTSNPHLSTPYQHMIPAPQNILGVDINSVSPLVKKAFLTDQKLPDFIRDLENKIYEENSSADYYKSTYKNRNTPYEDYYTKYDYSYDKYASTRRTDLLNEYELAALSSTHRTSYKDYFTRHDYGLLQHKRESYPTKTITKDFNFNKNIIEINQKVNQERYGNKRRKIEGEEEYQKLSITYDDENWDENINKNDASKFKIPSGMEKVINVTFELKNEKLKLTMEINRNNNVLLLKDTLVEKLKQKDRSKFKRISSHNIAMIKANSLMKDSKNISDYNVKNNDIIVVNIAYKLDEDVEEYYHKNIMGSSYNNINENKKRIVLSKNNEIADAKVLPVLTKPGYVTEPSYRDICRMTNEELRNVSNFSIYNRYGRVTWKENVDLTNQNLDNIVEIGEQYIEIYKDRSQLSPAGQGLNKPFVISMRVAPDSDTDLTQPDQRKEFLEDLQLFINKMGGKFLNYDDTNNELSFYCKQIVSQ